MRRRAYVESWRAHVNSRAVGGVVGALGAGLSRVAGAVLESLSVGAWTYYLARVMLWWGLSTVHGIWAVEGLGSLEGLIYQRELWGSDSQGLINQGRLRN
jgi:hypothetical protein